jgi:carbon-monoxide dehydrogenase medium subunit
MTGTGMMSFVYERPTDWSEAGRLLALPGAVAKMGGCDVLTKFRSGRLQAQTVVALNGLPGVDELSVDAGGARIGAAVTLAQLARRADFAAGWPVIANAAARIASPAIRASATLVGNVAQGWSVSDLVPLLQICDAALDIRGPAGGRQMSVADYAKTPGSAALRPGEAIVALTLKPLPADLRIAYKRFSFKAAFDLPLVSVAVAAAVKNGMCGDVRVAAVGGKAMPARCGEVEAALNGKGLDGAAIEAAAAALAVWSDPPADFRASAAYRRQVLTTMLRRALSTLAGA